MLRPYVLGLLGLVAVPALAADPTPLPKLSVLLVIYHSANNSFPGKGPRGFWKSNEEGGTETID